MTTAIQTENLKKKKTVWPNTHTPGALQMAQN